MIKPQRKTPRKLFSDTQFKNYLWNRIWAKVSGPKMSLDACPAYPPELDEMCYEIENGLLRYNMKYHIIGSSDWEF
jgi:serine protease inhibitor ecotin